MNRRLFLVIIAILLVVTVYMISRNFDKIPDKRTTAPGKYIKELQGNQAGVKGSHRRRDFDTEHQETLDHKVCDGVQTFLMFIGYPRSGHTLISSLLDAHPNAIVANEFEVIGKWQNWQTANKNKYYLFDQLYQNSKQEAEIGYRSASVSHRYNYSVPGQWQGTFNERILVIGSKKGGMTTKLLMKPENMKALKQLQRHLGISFKFIHVVRNPYDNIATMLLRALNKRPDADLGEKFQVNEPKNLDKEISKYLFLAERNRRLKSSLPGQVYEIHSSEMIQNPQKIILGICQFLDLTCDQKYLEDCSKIVYHKATKTRYNLVWTEAQKEFVNQQLQRFPFLKDYRFDD